MNTFHSRLRLIYLLPLATAIYLCKLFRAYLKQILIVLIIACPCIMLLSAFSVPDTVDMTVDMPDEMPQAEDSMSPFEPPVQVANDEPQTITLSFAGDCTLGMDQSFYYESSFNAMYEYNGPEFFLQNVNDIFSQDDLTIVPPRHRGEKRSESFRKLKHCLAP